MHWLDRATTVAMSRKPTGKRPFNLGWGDPAIVEWYLDNAATVPPAAEVTPTIRPARKGGAVTMRDLEFESPFDMLPPEARTVRARWITTDPEPERVVVLHPAWNDEDYTTRTRIAHDLVERGIASIMLQHPFYGERRRDTVLDNPVPLVSDFCVMGRGAVLEGMALVAHLVRAGYRVGVSGYSMGGNLAGFVGVLTDTPVAIAPLAASYSAAPVLLGGVHRNTIAWDALGGETPEVVARLTRVLSAGSILDHPPPEHAAAAVLVAGTRDGYVPTAAPQAIHHHWPGSRMEWVTAGHASLILRHRDILVAAIAESFDRVDALTVADGTAA
jgi:hypothetical protein